MFSIAAHISSTTNPQGKARMRRYSSLLAFCALAAIVALALCTPAQAHADRFPSGEGGLDVKVLTNVNPTVDENPVLHEVMISVKDEGGSALDDVLVTVAIVPPNNHGESFGEGVSGNTSAGGQLKVQDIFKDGHYRVEASKQGYTQSTPAPIIECRGIQDETWDIVLAKNKPVNPDGPSDPDNPDGPDGPDYPDNPDGPDSPDNPSNPDDPNNPSDPGQPGGSSGSSESGNPDDPKHLWTGLLSTGDGLPVMAACLLAVAAAAGVALFVLCTRKRGEHK